ncbi:MAG: helicase-related protein [Saprospiraceae bacterium]
MLSPDITDEQLEGAEFLAARPVAMLADRAGYGKTAQFIRACDLLCAQKITIICPPILRVNEQAEFEKWALWGLPIFIVRTGKDILPPGPGVIIASYKLAAESPLITRQLVKRGCDVLVLDEAHAVKDPKATRTKAIFRAGGIRSTAKRVWFITGTPTPNHAGEYSVFARISGAWTGTHPEFIERYCEVAEPPGDYEPGTYFGLARAAGTWRGTYPEFLARYYKVGPPGTRPEPISRSQLKFLIRMKITGSKNVDELKAMLAPFVLARYKVDPGRAPLTVDELSVDGKLPDFADVDPLALEAIRDAIEAQDWHKLNGPAVATVRRYIGLAKAPGAAELIATELAGGAGQIIVFCEHTAVIDTIAAKLGNAAAIIDGRTPQKRREEILRTFQFEGSPRVLICQRMALKEGVTLTAATRVLLVEPPWTPDDCEQMIARAWRRGQSSHVYASYLYLQGSFDQRIAATLARKSLDIAQISLAQNR